MGFEWDERKRERNLGHRTIGFVDVLPPFEGETLEIADDRFDYGETRRACLRGCLYVAWRKPTDH